LVLPHHQLSQEGGNLLADTQFFSGQFLNYKKMEAWLLSSAWKTHVQNLFRAWFKLILTRKLTWQSIESSDSSPLWSQTLYLVEFLNSKNSTTYAWTTKWRTGAIATKDRLAAVMKGAAVKLAMNKPKIPINQLQAQRFRKALRG